MNHRIFKELTKARIEEARILLEQKKYSGAYYLSGYSIEFALKACIAKKFRRFEFPDKRFVLDCYTHNLKDLVKLAELENKRKEKEEADQDFAINWAIVKDWNENSRYQIFKKAQALDLFSAISSEKGGILSWIQQYW